MKIIQKTFGSTDLAGPLFFIKTDLFIESTVLKCEERVLSHNPCEMKTCPHGKNGRYEMVFYECPRIPDFCPMSVKNSSARCCPEKCGKGHNKNKQTNKQTNTKKEKNTHVLTNPTVNQSSKRQTILVLRGRDRFGQQQAWRPRTRADLSSMRRILISYSQPNQI